MHAMNSDRGGGGGGGSWRLPPDETLQVQDPKDKLPDVSAKPNVKSVYYRYNLLINKTLNTFDKTGVRLWRNSQLEEHNLLIASDQYGNSGHRYSNIPFRVIITIKKKSNPYFITVESK